MKQKVISLFSGAGGLDIAVDRCAEPAGVQDGTLGPLEVAVSTDYDELSTATFQANFPRVPVIVDDIRVIATQDILDAANLDREEPVLVIGGPPCTPFSKSGFWIEEKRNSMDPNASLLDEYVRVVGEARPEAFILENVQGLTYGTHQLQFNRLLTQLRDLGYNPQWQVLNAAEYGVPQLRRRVFVVGRRDGIAFRSPRPTHGGVSERVDTSDSVRLPFVTSRDVMGDLLPGIPERGELLEGTYGELAAEVPPGQNYLWHTERYGGQPVFKWRSRYWTFLLRLDPDRPATTLQAQPGPWVGPFHWENLPNAQGELRARRLRVPEVLRLMTFPDAFQLVGNRATIQRQLGNAVPVELGKVVVRALMEQLGYLEPTPDDTLRQMPLLLRT